MFFLCSAVFDQLDLVTYEEVVKLPSFKRKTLVLLGKYFIMVKLVFVSLVGVIIVTSSFRDLGFKSF